MGHIIDTLSREERIMPTTSYDPVASQLLASVCELTYTQYEHGPPPGNNGQITPPAGYTQIASFTAPEIAMTRDRCGLKSREYSRYGADAFSNISRI